MAALVALVSSLGWGTSDYFGGRYSGRVGLLRTLLVSQVVAAIVLTVVVAAAAGGLPGAVVLPAALAGAAELVGVGALYRGLAVGKAGLVAPAAAASPVVPLAVGLLSGERPGPLTWTALALVVAGLVTAAHEPERDPGAEGAGSSFDLRSLAHGLLAAAGFGAYFVFMAGASAVSVPWALLIARATCVVGLVAAAAVTARSVGLTRRAVAGLAAIGVLVVVSDGAYAVASTLGSLVLVAVLGATHPVVTILWARVHSGERMSRLRVGGVVTTLVGAIGLSLA